MSCRICITSTNIRWPLIFMSILQKKSNFSKTLFKVKNPPKVPKAENDALRDEGEYVN